MDRKKISILLGFIIVLLFAFSCSLDQEIDAAKNKSNKGTIQDEPTMPDWPEVDCEQIKKLKTELKGLEDTEGLIGSGGKGLSDEPTEPIVTSEKKEEDGVHVTYVTTTKKYKVTAEFDTHMLLAGNDSIYPGAVFSGQSVVGGSYTPVDFGKKLHQTISYDLIGKGLAISGKIRPTLSEYRELHNSIINQNFPKQSTSYSYEQTQIKNEAEFKAKFLVDASLGGEEVRGKFDNAFNFGSETKKNKFMIKFAEVFYSVDLDISEVGFLYEDFDIEDFGGHKPVYVSSVTYGRVAYLTVETDYNWSELSEKLDAVIEAKGKNGTGDIDVLMNNIADKSSVKIFVVGSTDPVATTIDGLKNFIKGDSFPQNKGKIISYKLRFVEDNARACVSYESNYETVEIERFEGNKVRYRVQLKAGWVTNNTGEKSEIYGSVDWKSDLNSHYATLWSYPENNRLAVFTGENYIGYKTPNVFNDNVQKVFDDENDKFNIVVSGLKKHRTWLFSDYSYLTVTVSKTVKELMTDADYGYDTFWTGKFLIKSQQSGDVNKNFEFEIPYYVTKLDD